MVMEKENYHLSEKMAKVDPNSSEYNRLEREMLANNATLKELNDELNKPKRTMVEALKELDKWQKILIANQKKLAEGSEDQESVLEAEDKLSKIKEELSLMGWEDPTKSKSGKKTDDTLKKYLEGVTATVNEYKERFNIYKAMTEKGNNADMDFEFTFNGEPNLVEFIKKQMKAIGGESLNLAVDFKTAKFEDLNLGDNLKEEEVAKLKSLFDELRKMSLSEYQDIDKLLTKYASYTTRKAELDRNYIKEKKALFDANADSSEVVEQLRVYREESDKLVMEFAKKDDVFNQFVTSIATQSVDRLRFMLMQLQAELVRSKVQGMDAESLVTLRAKIKALEEALKTAKTDINQAKDVEDSYRSWKRLQSVLTKVNRTFDEIGNSVGGLAGEIISTAGEVTTSTLQMVNGITMLANWSIEATKMTAEGTAKSIQAVEKASVILAIIGAALQVATKIWNVLNRTDELSEKTINTYKALIDITNKVIDSQKELISSLSGVQANLELAKTNRLLEIQRQAAKDLGKEYMASGSGIFKHSYGYKMQKDLKKFAGDFAKIGINYSSLGGRLEGLFDLSPDQLELIQKEMPKFWAGLTDDARGYLEEIIEVDSKTKELGETVKLALTGNEFDSILSGLDEFIMSADKDFEALSGNFEEYMLNAIMNIVKTQYLTDALTGWYSEFADKMGDGVLSKTDKEQLEDAYKAIAEEARKQFDAAKSIAGVESGKTNLTGISKNIAGITEDSALIIAGYLDSLRFRLFQYFDYMQSPEQAGAMALMVQSQNNMIFHLQAIEANTKVTADTNTAMLTNLNKVISVDGVRGAYGITVNT